jgi:hypothetical protein
VAAVLSFYVFMVNAEKMTIDEVPTAWRAEVQAAIAEQGQ